MTITENKMRTQDEIEVRLAELTYGLYLDDDEFYLDEGEQAEVEALSWVLDRSHKESNIKAKALAYIKEQELNNG